MKEKRSKKEIGEIQPSPFAKLQKKIMTSDPSQVVSSWLIPLKYSQNDWRQIPLSAKKKNTVVQYHNLHPLIEMAQLHN